MSSQSDVGFGSGPGTSVLSGSAATTLLAALILAVFVVHFLFLAVVAEDAFISFRFAQNVAGGHGFLWNIGEAPVEFILVLPYLVTVILLAGFFGKANPPKALGTPYVKER